MGADLIAYTVVGPVKLKPSKTAIKKALSYANNVVGAARQAGKDADFDWKLGDKFLSRFETEDYAGIASLSPETVLRELISLWKHGSRDSTSRTVTINKKKVMILTAGEASWGDEPGGAGYTTLRDADYLGMLEPLGIL
jgi:hypothetical protein